jgi:hypothetical protein
MALKESSLNMGFTPPPRRLLRSEIFSGYLRKFTKTTKQIFTYLNMYGFYLNFIIIFVNRNLNSPNIDSMSGDDDKGQEPEPPQEQRNNNNNNNNNRHPKDVARMRFSSASTQAIASIGSYCLANTAMTVTNKYVFSVNPLTYRLLRLLQTNIFCAGRNV